MDFVINAQFYERKTVELISVFQSKKLLSLITSI